MNILYIAYSCDPYYGSEDKIGWNIPFENSKEHNVFLITKSEHIKSFERYEKENGKLNFSYYFADINEIYKKLFKGPLYSGRLNVWHSNAYKIAKKICSENDIDVIHQITPIEFRSIGKYYKINSAKFVCGPLGGGEEIAEGLEAYAKENRLIELVRKLSNSFYRIKFRRISKKCDKLLFANNETADYLGIDDADLMTEIAICENELCSVEKLKDKELILPPVFLVCSRTTYRKGQQFLLDAVEEIDEALSYKIKIIGWGEDFDALKQRINKSQNLKKHIILLDKVPYAQMQNEYSNASALILPSIRETTGTVVLEAMANGLPVISLDKFGAYIIGDDTTSFFISGKSREGYINSLKSILISCIENPSKTKEKGLNARLKAEKFTYEEKIKTYNSIYESLIN